MKAMPSSFFLYGPHYCGKTLIVQALARRPHCRLLPNRATAAGNRWRGLFGIVGEVVGTDTAVVFTGDVELRPLRPASGNTCTKLGGIHQHHIGVPIFKRAELPDLGVLLQRQPLHILHGLAAGYHAGVVLVDAEKLGDRPPYSLPLLSALLTLVTLPDRRLEGRVGVRNASPHPVDVLIARLNGIINNTDPSFGQSQAPLLTLDGPPSPTGLLLIPRILRALRLQRLTCHPLALAPALLLRLPCRSTPTPCRRWTLRRKLPHRRYT